MINSYREFKECFEYFQRMQSIYESICDSELLDRYCPKAIYPFAETFEQFAAQVVNDNFFHKLIEECKPGAKTLGDFFACQEAILSPREEIGPWSDVDA